MPDTSKPSNIVLYSNCRFRVVLAIVALIQNAQVMQRCKFTHNYVLQICEEANAHSGSCMPVLAITKFSTKNGEKVITAPPVLIFF